jgi:exopolyphosphatase/guanosine-5'-triphosphate,3'-diphosphate pyrophosphatase
VHDVGYLINYAGHHKHSYHLIAHSDISGFTASEIAIIANVARYHRRSEPRKSHGAFARLEKPDRRIVKALAAILRVADGLDRTHTQQIESIELRSDRHGTLTCLVRSASEPLVDIWGAVRKAGLLMQVLKQPVQFEWVPSERISPSATVR